MAILSQMATGDQLVDKADNPESCFKRCQLRVQNRLREKMFLLQSRREMYWNANVQDAKTVKPPHRVGYWIRIEDNLLWQRQLWWIFLLVTLSSGWACLFVQSCISKIIRFFCMKVYIHNTIFISKGHVMKNSGSAQMCPKWSHNYQTFGFTFIEFSIRYFCFFARS